MPNPTGEDSRSSPLGRLDEIATTFEKAEAPLSSAEIDVLLRAYAQNVQLAIDAETHRSTVMTFVFTAAGALVYALSAGKFTPQFWPIAIIVGILGSFAAVLSDVYHERWEFYMTIATGYRRRVAAALPATRLEEIRVAASAAHAASFKRRIPLHRVWKYLALGIAATGFSCAGIMLLIQFGWVK